MGRLHKLRALFCSGTPFERLPEALGDCASLSQIGFRGCGPPATAVYPRRHPGGLPMMRFFAALDGMALPTQTSR